MKTSRNRWNKLKFIHCGSNIEVQNINDDGCYHLFLNDVLSSRLFLDGDRLIDDPMSGNHRRVTDDRQLAVLHTLITALNDL